MRIDVFKGDQLLGGYHVEGSSDIRVGRDRKNQIILSHSTVSRHHASLLRQGSKLLLVDRSTNGTFKGGAAVDKILLQFGDEITIGPFTLRYVKDAPEWESPTAEIEDLAFGGIIGVSEEMTRVVEMVQKVAGSAGTVLVVGETGSGKELVARAVHDASPRAAGSYVTINCGAISSELIESELFGHVKGAFTGAIADRKGAFEQAHGGTLFLDEVGELPVELQPKLLRVLETGEIRSVGAQESRKVDVRVVAATHRDLPTEVERGSFRADLLYRLHVLPVVVPPLRDRLDDVLPLTEYFLGSDAQISAEAKGVLLAQAWHGNVRELKNVLERARILSGDNPISPDDLVFLEEPGGDNTVFLDGAGGYRSFEEVERLYYSRALEKAGGNIRTAARQLGMPKSTFYDRLKKYGLNKKGSRD
jgi:transcriptional regulator with GAF, ATPase, and Fis domain